MKLEIKLENSKERALKKAELVIKLFLKDGTQQSLPSQKADIRGEISLDDFPQDTFKKINFSKSQYQIYIGNKKTPWLKLGKPHKVSTDHYQFTLIAKNLSAESKKPDTNNYSPEKPPEKPPTNTSNITPDNKTDKPAKPGLDIKQPPLLKEFNQNQWVITGKLTKANGNSLKNTSIIAYSVDVNGNTEIAKTKTGENGQYRIRYKWSSKRTPDIQVQAKNKNKVIVESNIYFSAGRRIKIDLVTNNEAYIGPNKFDQIEKKIVACNGNISFQNINEKKIEYILGKTKIAAPDLKHYIAARRFSTDTEVPAMAYYGLFSSGIAPNLQALSTCSAQDLDSAMRASIKKNKVSPDCTNYVTHIHRDIKTQSIQGAISTSDQLSDASIGDLLSLAKVPLKNQTDLLNLYEQHTDNRKGFWHELAGHPTHAKYAASVKRIFQLGALSDYFYPAVAAINHKLGDRGRFENLATWQQKDWKKIESQLKTVPDSIAGKNLNQRKQNYINMMQTTVEHALVKERTAQVLLSSETFKKVGVNQIIKAAPEMDLQTADIGKKLDELKIGGKKRPLLEKNLKSIQRIYRIAPQAHKPEVTEVLFDKNLDSAAKIAKYGKKPFIVNFSKELGGKEIATQVFNNAQKITAINNHIATAMAEVKNASQLGMIGGSEKSSDLNIPSYNELFGSQSYCECEHCISVYSPAAYLVDLLELLDKSLVEKTLGSGKYIRGTRPSASALPANIVPKVFKTGLNVLFHNRREDIGHIELNCTNTHTLMPYIDLLNEQLEREVIRLSGGTAPNAKDYQTTGNEQELKANPEHISNKAYDILADSETGMQLPFSLWNTEADRYLEKLDVKRHDLITLIQGGVEAKLDNFDRIATAHLSLSQREVDILGKRSHHSESRLRGLYGGLFFDSSKWKKELSEVPNFLQRTQLTFDELLSLLNTRFISQFGPIGIDFSDAKSVCDIEGAKLAYIQKEKFSEKSLSLESLDMIQRFLRLRNKTQWSIHELDCVLSALNESYIQKAGLTKIGLIYALARQHHLSPLEVASWLGLISTIHNPTETEERSYYETVFQNPAVSSPIESAFDIDPDNPKRLLIDSNTVELTQHLPAIAGAIQLSQADTTQLMDSLLSNTQFSLSNLNALYRVASFCRSYKISIHDYLLLQRILNFDPWKNAQSLHTFIRALESINTSAFSISELAYILLHDTQSVTEHTLSDTELGVLLQTLSNKVAEIWAQYAINHTPTKEQLFSLLEHICIEGGAEQVLQSIGIELDQSDSNLLTMQFYQSDIPSWFKDLLVYDHTIANTIRADTELNAEQKSAAIQQAHWEMALPILSQALIQEHTIGVLKELIATQFDLPLSIAETLLLEMTQPFGSAPLNILSEIDFVYFDSENTDDFSIAAELNTQQELLKYIAKVALVLVRIDADEQVLTLLMEHTLSPALLDLSALPTSEQSHAEETFQAWWLTQTIADINASSQTNDTSLAKLLLALLNDSDEIDSLSIEKERPDVEALIADSNNNWDRTKENTLLFLDELAKLIDVSLIDLATIADSDWLNLSLSDLSNGKQLITLIQIAEFVIKTGANPALLKHCSTLDVSYEHAKQMIQAVRSHYSLEEWYQIAPDIRNPLRELQRDKLIAKLLHSKVYDHSSDIYNHLLIDPEMSACMMTSRIKLALSSVQLFLQRCILNIEEELVEVHEPDSWDWRKNYRVWEANRKVFLYPENWIEPELRLTKSEQFDAALGVLLQNEVTDDIARKATLSYLTGLDEVANIEVLNAYHELNEAPGSECDNLHIIARSRGVPGSYYYRLRENGLWQPWEAIDLGISSRQVVPVVKDKRLFLMWPSFVEKQTSGTDVLSESHIDSTVESIVEEDYHNYLMNYIFVPSDGIIYFPVRLSDSYDSLEDAANDEGMSVNQLISELRSYGAISIDEYGEDVRQKAENTFNYYEIKLNISEKTEDGWQKTITSETFIESDKVRAAIGLFEETLPSATTDDFHFFSDISHDTIKIECVQTLRYEDVTYEFEEGRFEHNILSKSISAYESKDDLDFLDILLLLFGIVVPRNVERPTGTDLVANAFTELSYSHYQIPESDNNNDLLTLLERTPNTFKTPIQSQFSGLTSDRPFFYGDKNTFYLVERTKEGLTINSQESNWLNEAPLTTNKGGVIKKAEKLSPNVAERPVLTPKTQSISKVTGRTQSHIGNVSQHLARDLKDKKITKTINTRTNRYQFTQLYHPQMGELIRIANVSSLTEALSRDTQSLSEAYFDSNYSPTSAVPENRHPLKQFYFNSHNANSFYNWELFFHLPLLTATRLSKNQQFAEAQKWFHIIFDPTCRTGGEGVKRYWQFKPFYDLYDTNADHPSVSIYQQLLTMSQVENSNSQQANTAVEIEISKDTQAQIETWLANPFDPHAIAAIRPVAYMKATVVKYLENLIEWGDYLFKQFTIESINEATQYYILAYQILGERPQALPKLQVKTNSYFELGETDDFSNAIAELENTLSLPLLGNDVSDLQALYFCIPNNPNLIQYWDTVEDRLFKIRHCMDIDGVKRQLPLFQPPIDPAMLVNAVAAGVDIGSALAGLNTPAPKYRFQYLVQKARDYCQEVKTLGSHLLTALEKQDAEELTILQADHQETLLHASNTIRNKQVEEARENLRAIEKTKASIEERINYYENLKKRSEKEKSAIQLLDKADKQRKKAAGVNTAASIVSALGDLTFTASPTCPGVSYSYGSSHISAGLRAIASGHQNASARDNYQASKVNTEASHDRRWDDWKLQERLAKKELKQIENQIAAAEIRLALTEKERDNHLLQLEQSREIRDMMVSKFSNADLYAWQSSQVSSIYFQSYQLAYDLAKRAEKAWQREMGTDSNEFIAFGYWDSLKKGLMSGEKLQHDIQRMESEYINKNTREYELSKTISLLQLDPDALLTLKTTGECFIDIPEVLFDLDYPNHYFRRIKSVSLSIPLLSGPYTTIASTLTLLTDTLRINPDKADDIAIDTEQNLRINYAASESIATSSAQSDSGLFQLDYNDERYLPFEGAGVVSQWKLKIADPDLAQFDFDTISDVLIQLHYTARNGGDTYGSTVENHLKANLGWVDTNVNQVQQLISLRTVFTNEWAALLSQGMEEDGSIRYEFPIHFDSDMLPYLLRKRLQGLSGLRLLVDTKDNHDISWTYALTNRLLNPDTVTNEAQGYTTDWDITIPFNEEQAVTAHPMETEYQLRLHIEQQEQLQNIRDIYLLCTFDTNAVET